MEWIRSYKSREAGGQEAYYLVCRLDDGSPCGSVRLYDFEPNRFTWGSWILDSNKPAKAALESAVLSFGIGFERTGIATALIEVRKSNTHAIAFYQRFGMLQTAQNTDHLYFEYSKQAHVSSRTAHLETLKAQACA